MELLGSEIDLVPPGALPGRFAGENQVIWASEYSEDGTGSFNKDIVGVTHLTLAHPQNSSTNPCQNQLWDPTLWWVQHPSPSLVFLTIHCFYLSDQSLQGIESCESIELHGVIRCIDTPASALLARSLGTG